MQLRLLKLAILATSILPVWSPLLAQVSNLTSAQQAAMGAVDARPTLLAVEAANGYKNVKSIEYTGSGMFAAVGQMYSVDHTSLGDWPRFEVPSYKRSIDFGAMSSHEEYTDRQGPYPTLGGGGTPMTDKQSRATFLSGNYAWDVNDGKVVPQMGGHLYGSPEVAYRQLQIDMTPIGFVKAALAPGANPIMVPLQIGNYAGPPFIHNGDTDRMVSLTVMGKYNVIATINPQNQIVLIVSWIGNPVLGDMEMEIRCLNYKDFGGVKYPTILHIHEGDRLVAYAHNSGLINVKDLRANVEVPAAAVPEAVKTADPSVTHVTTKKLADGVWLIGGSDLNSVAIEFKDWVTVVEAPENEARSVAVIDEISRLAPNKPIRYVVNTHVHWDHIGGLRTYMTNGTTTVSSEFYKSYYHDILYRLAPNRTLEPDRFSTFYPYIAESREPSMEVVTDRGKLDISDGTRTIQIYPVDGVDVFSKVEVSPINEEYANNLRYFHVESNLLVYLPKEKILINSDQYTPATKDDPNPNNNIEVMQGLEGVVKAWNLDVDQHVSIEGKEPGSNTQFLQLLSDMDKNGTPAEQYMQHLFGGK